jgi:hypothetical protein
MYTYAAGGKAMAKAIEGRTTAKIVERLTAEIRRVEGLHHAASDETVTTGCLALDRLLPGGGLRRGTLVEWLAAETGSGATTLALLAAREACRQGGLVAVLDRERWFYPPAAAGLQVDLERLLVVRPPNRRDDAWALDQLLRSRAIGAVVAWPDDWDQHTFRRLQLAAEVGEGLGLLVRPASVRSEPSWAELRLLVDPLPMLPGEAPSSMQRNMTLPTALPMTALPMTTLPTAALRAARQPGGLGRRWRLEVLRVRGAKDGAAVEVELDERTGVLHESWPENSVRLASSVGARAPERRSRGA